MPRGRSNGVKRLQSGDESLSDGEEKTSGAICFYVNKSGLPMDNFTWERMWDHVLKIHPDGAKAFRGIRNDRHLPEIQVPHAPLNFPSDMSTQDKINAVQHYFLQLQYNHTGTQFFDIKKSRPLCGLMECAKDMIRESLPIKCLEAVILAIYLTNSLTAVDRFPISFRSTMKGNVYRHVVLGLHHNGRYGALGLSRRDDLMYKPFIYAQLSEMITNYLNSYEKYWHTVDRVKIGLAVPHDAHTYETIQWRALCLSINKLSHKDICRELDNYSREIRKQTTRWQKVNVVTKSEKAGSLSPKKSLKPTKSAPAVLPSKPLNNITLPERLLADHTSSSLFTSGDNESDTLSTPLPPPGAGVMNHFPHERLSSQSSRFSFTELYEIRV